MKGWTQKDIDNYNERKNKNIPSKHNNVDPQLQKLKNDSKRKTDNQSKETRKNEQVLCRPRLWLALRLFLYLFLYFFSID